MRQMRKNKREKKKQMFFPHPVTRKFYTRLKKDIISRAIDKCKQVLLIDKQGPGISLHIMISERKTNRATSRHSVNRLSNSSQLRSTTLTNKANFVTDFLKFCPDHDVFLSPEFRIIKGKETLRIIPSVKIETNNHEISSHDRLIENVVDESGKFTEQPEIIKQTIESKGTVFSLIYENQVELDAPKDLRSKDCKISASMIGVLKNCMKKYTTITTLRLKNCSINAFGISLIFETLSEPDCSIKDLNLDMNPNIEQNYHLLCAPGTNLYYLSLKLCEINDDGIAKISSNLKHRDEPQTPKLIVLNLANNNISCSGAANIGTMLRTNRSLQSLTLTGNKIGDTGVECILEPLSTFNLTQNEVVEKRRRKIERLKIFKDKMDNVSGESLRMEPAEANIKDRGRGSRASGKKRRASSGQVISNSSESSANQLTPVKVKSVRERVEAIIPVDTHPLVKDVISTEDTLSCTGNIELQHLNLSFNKITEETLRCLIECVKKQREILADEIGRGLQHLNVEGNDVDSSCDLAIQLDEIIKQRRRSK